MIIAVVLRENSTRVTMTASRQRNCVPFMQHNYHVPQLPRTTLTTTTHQLQHHATYTYSTQNHDHDDAASAVRTFALEPLQRRVRTFKQAGALDGYLHLREAILVCPTVSV